VIWDKIKNGIVRLGPEFDQRRNTASTQHKVKVMLSKGVHRKADERFETLPFKKAFTLFVKEVGQCQINGSCANLIARGLEGIRDSLPIETVEDLRAALACAQDRIEKEAYRSWREPRECGLASVVQEFRWSIHDAEDLADAEAKIFQAAHYCLKKRAPITEGHAFSEMRGDLRLHPRINPGEIIVKEDEWWPDPGAATLMRFLEGFTR
jgi:hypothetical protein